MIAKEEKRKREEAEEAERKRKEAEDREKKMAEIAKLNASERKRLEEEEAKRKQAEAEAAKKATTPQPKPLNAPKQKPQPKEILIHQKQQGVFAEGNYERGLTDEERIERGKLKIENEGIYKIKSVEEMDVEEANASFQLNMRDAIVGSVILERKF